MEIFEVSIGRVIEFEEFGREFSIFYGVPEDFVLPADDYWERVIANDYACAGVKLFIDGGDFPALIRGYSDLDVLGEGLGKFAAYLAVALNTEIAIGDFIDSHEGGFIVYYPSGRARFADERCGDEFSLDLGDWLP